MKPEATWFVVSDSERMKVYSFIEAADKSKRFVQLEERVHPASALKNSELTSSDQGHFKIMTRSSGVGKSQGSKYQPRYEPHLLEAMHFAKEVADHLHASYTRGKFKHLILCAAEHFYGLLHKQLSAKLTKVTHIEVKGYTKKPIKELEALALKVLKANPEAAKSIMTKPNTAPVKKKAVLKAKVKVKPKAKIIPQAKAVIKPAPKAKAKVKAKVAVKAKPKAKAKPAKKVVSKAKKK